ncbi:MAG: hypothetical protein QOE99_1521, partial [Actinomycetota bacterium]|nr:hypothetical protein [Actinomycetota bacterium]
RTVTIPAGWLLDGRLVPAYALTCYKAQGLTCEHALVYGTAALSQQSGYVAMSRGRTSNHLYTILDPSVSGDKPDSGLENREVLDDLCRALARDDRQQLASPRLAAPARELQPDPFQQWALQAAQNRSERDRADDHQWDFDHHQAHDIGRSR